MSSARKITATLHSADCIGWSVTGNPGWRLATSEGMFITRSDASVSCGSENDSPVGKEVEITVAPAGRVIDLRVVEPT